MARRPERNPIPTKWGIAACIHLPKYVGFPVDLRGISMFNIAIFLKARNGSKTFPEGQVNPCITEYINSFFGFCLSSFLLFFSYTAVLPESIEPGLVNGLAFLQIHNQAGMRLTVYGRMRPLSAKCRSLGRFSMK